MENPGQIDRTMPGIKAIYHDGELVYESSSGLFAKDRPFDLAVGDEGDRRKE